MNPKEQRRFDHLYELMLRDLILRVLRPKIVEAYSRAIRLTVRAPSTTG